VAARLRVDRDVGTPVADRPGPTKAKNRTRNPCTETAAVRRRVPSGVRSVTTAASMGANPTTASTRSAAPALDAVACQTLGFTSSGTTNPSKSLPPPANNPRFSIAGRPPGER